MKRILGLDLGTNSIGWALINISEVENSQIIEGIGSRIIPMDAATLSDFDKGTSKSPTSDRTDFRGIRRLRERYLLRRERLHRVLHIMGFLPTHYEQFIDFVDKLGKFSDNNETKLPWRKNADCSFEFIFKTSFNEMVCEFKKMQPKLFEKNKLIPYDWTIYYLRKKALSKRIDKEELAWLLLNFNHKRGYYQLRGEEEEENENKLVNFHSLQVIKVEADQPDKKEKDKIWYNVHLENGWIYRRSSNILLDWVGKTKEFIVTTEIDENGKIKVDKEGNEKRSFRAPLETDWTLIKKKTEFDIEKSGKTVGQYIYDTLLQNPSQKINGKLVRTVERKFYKEELKIILEKQKEFHPELHDTTLYDSCIEELYKNNDAHRNLIGRRGFTHLFLNDIIFYQRPLKSKKSLISNCQYESRTYIDKETKEKKTEPIKCIPKSHPLFQEFRLWQFIQNLKIYEKERTVEGKLKTDIDTTSEFLKNENDYVLLFDWLSDHKEIDQKRFLKYPAFGLKKNTDKFRWNYVEDKLYPCNETRAAFKNKLKSVIDIPESFPSEAIEEELWHILYSVEDNHELSKALQSFAKKHNLGKDFSEVFLKFPPFKKEYGAYSAKAIKKLLPLMRMGKYWSIEKFHEQTRQRIDKIINGEYDENIRNRVREKAISLTEINNFKALPLWLACYIVYDRHSEAGEIQKWETPADLEKYIKEFKQHSLRNPIVEQVLTETLRIVRDIWLKYGDFKEIHIELGREMKNPANVRAKMTAKISENENTNLRIKALLAELINHNEIENVRPFSPSQQEILKIYESGILNSANEIPDDIAQIVKSGKPSQSELIRYKCWLEQGYRSPYTGEMIPLGKLFTSAYEIEHIIPQSRFFDDSLSNKVICETEVNKEKDNELGYEFIKNNEGRIIELSFGKRVKIFTSTEYEDFVKHHYKNDRGKMKKLLMEDIPETFIERQLNDSRYISKEVKRLLSNIVREKDEQEATSKNVISCNGVITDTLKKDWGLKDVWNTMISPRFERMNLLTNSNVFGQWTNKDGKKVFQTNMPLDLQKGFNKKRIDHRHHAMDALTIACATRSHVNYLNNESANAIEIRYDLKHNLCFKAKTGENGSYKWQFKKPWDTFTQDAHSALENIIVSYKQNIRVINKTVNKYQHFVEGKKIMDIQINGDSWSIRKPLHADTIKGKVNLRFTKKVLLSDGIKKWEILVDKSLKTKIKQLINEGYDDKKIIKFFKDLNYKWQGNDISKLDIYYFSDEKEILIASRVNLDEKFNAKKIESITDTGIQKILLRHLAKYNDRKDEKGKLIAAEILAFSADGIDDLNKNILELNNGKPHQPILKVRTYEPKGNKFNVGYSGNKKDKFVKAAEGTNLFYAVYRNENGVRSYETIPLNIVIERQKQGLNSAPETNKKGDPLLFILSPNDLVYVPTIDEIQTQTSPNFHNSNLLKGQIYKFVSCTENEGHFIPNTVAYPIKQTTELGSNNKAQRAWTGEMIKEICIPIRVDRLGFITNY